ncbi:unnamed protein product [Microthlaspi erraticum]|uniref:Uncharacterized protein n=1 Tax=Microthlaspi erraticum TaxID=1685480 RepID=A0A6D2HKI7_9BRAS|nr:unnamed protein product [Microthlaspi erraticum]
MEESVDKKEYVEDPPLQATGWTDPEWGEDSFEGCTSPPVKYFEDPEHEKLLRLCARQLIESKQYVIRRVWRALTVTIKPGASTLQRWPASVSEYTTRKRF